MGWKIISPLPQHYVQLYTILYEQLKMIPESYIIVNGIKICLISLYGLTIATPEYRYICDPYRIDVKDTVDHNEIISWNHHNNELNARKPHKQIAYDVMLRCFDIFEMIISSANRLTILMPANTRDFDSASLYQWLIKHS